MRHSPGFAPLIQIRVGDFLEIRLGHAAVEVGGLHHILWSLTISPQTQPHSLHPFHRQIQDLGGDNVDVLIDPYFLPSISGALERDLNLNLSACS